MIVLIIAVVSTFIYYLGLSYITDVAFKNRKIRLSWGLKFFMPIYIFKTYIKVIKDHWREPTKKQAIKSLFFGYDLALTILVEIVAFSFEKGLIEADKKTKSSTFSKISNLKLNSIRNPFTNSIEKQFGCA